MTEDQDKRLVREIRLANLLSFGSKAVVLPLANLNVLIGPNGAGKSNLIATLAATGVSRSWIC
jgi:predicted ATPase